jgi:hypothetical protein
MSFVLALLPLISVAQTTNPLSLVLEKGNPSPEIKRRVNPDDIVKEEIFGRNYLLPNAKEVTLASGEAEIHVDRFFEDFASNKKLGKVHFGMTPIPSLYFQSENKKIQYIGGTTGAKTEFLFRYIF